MKQQKVYQVDGTHWVQSELNYAEFLQAIEVLRGQFTEFAASQQSLGDMLTNLADSKILPKLGAVVLRETKNPALRVLGTIRGQGRTITRENVVEHMTLQQVAEVLLDFFNLNVGSMLNSMTSEKVFSTTNPSVQKILDALWRGRNASLTSPTGMSGPVN